MLVDLQGNAESGYRCSNPACGAGLTKCHNYQIEQVCNRCIALPPSGQPTEIFCSCCRYNTVIPNLTNDDNREKWRRIEAAKRRVFYHLDLLGLPHGKASDGFVPPLSFEFKEDFSSLENPQPMGDFGEYETVMTGHLNGKITINIQEADSVERERLRVHFGEQHRSLIGHFRHEMSHYYWDLLIKGKREEAFKAVFGDHNNPPYADAMRRHYQQGPPNDWGTRYTSAYASMHPWEDFAETFTAYLEMVAALDTAFHLGLGGPGVYVNFDEMVAAYKRLGMAMNEMNRTMGLKDLMTRPLVASVIKKLRYIHQLVRNVHVPGSTSSSIN